MSIIHEALKKAEREREPRRTGLPFYGRGRAPRRVLRWPAVVAGLLTGLTTIWAVSTWLRLYSLEVDRQGGTATPPTQGVRAAEQGGGDQLALQTHIVHPPSTQEPLAAAPPAHPVDTPWLPAALPLTSEAQVAAQATFERAQAAESRGQWEEAKGHYRQALTLNPTLVEARNNLGTLYVRQHQLTAAIDEFLAAVRLDPRYAKVRNNLGSAYLLSGREALAVQEFLAALHIDGAYVSPLYNLASLYARRGDVGQAVAFLTRALAIEPAVLSWMQEDPDFDSIKTAPAVQRLYTQSHAKR
jgi:tetratricopeptide (TPR) repeat protein